MAQAVTRTLGGSAACGREAEPPPGHSLAEPRNEDKRGQGGKEGIEDLADWLSIEIVSIGIDNLHRNQSS